LGSQITPRGHIYRGHMADALSKLKIHSQLNQKIWDGDVLRPTVRKRMLTIARGFLEELELPFKLEDIVFTGSLANFNYSSHSDIDLHAILDFAATDENEELVRKFLIARKSVWNDIHKIMLRGHEVEIYAENIGDPHHSTGVYSVLNNKWIKKPRPDKGEQIIDYYAVIHKADDLIGKIERTVNLSTLDKLDKIQTLKEKIRHMRQCGLETGGEYSIENLAFKILRNEGHIERLWDEAVKVEDDMLSLEIVNH